MYLEFFGLNEFPFNITPDPRFLYFSPRHREAMDLLLYGIANRKGFIELSGEVGCGKTTPLRAVLSRLPQDVETALVLNPCLNESQLLRAILNDFGISVQQTDDDTLTAYVPVQLVSDDTGDANVAFYARMYYQAGASWGDAQSVRLVWIVQMLNDICSAYDNGICSEYSDLNEIQVIQTYDDEWYLTGLHVVEEHSADIALIYEDPQLTPTIEPGADDKPLYLDVLYGLLYGLDNSFLAGRDCDTVDGDGNCVGNGQLDVTVDTIGDRFNHATNSYDINDPAYWGLPNVLSVVKNGVARTPGDGLSSYADIAS